MTKILIIGPAWVGDMIMAQTLFQQLKSDDPSIQIDVIAPAWTNALLSRMPEVDNTIELPIKHGKLALKKRYQIGKKLRKHQYVQAIVLPNSWKSALIPWFAHIPIRTGWMRECRYGLLNDWRKLDKQRYPLMIERFLALGLLKSAPLKKPYPKPHLQPDENCQQAAVKKFHLNIEEAIVALCPGAEFGWSKRWPAEYFAQIANQQLDAGKQVWLFGSPNDKAIGEKIQSLTNHRCTNLIGNTSLSEAIDLLAFAETAVCNDSGLMHIACALGKKVIAIYGSTSPDFTPPLSEKAHVAKLNLPCQPCFQRECPLKHWNCMRQLTPDKINQYIES